MKFNATSSRARSWAADRRGGTGLEGKYDDAGQARAFRWAAADPSRELDLDRQHRASRGRALSRSRRHRFSGSRGAPFLRRTRSSERRVRGAAREPGPASGRSARVPRPQQRPVLPGAVRRDPRGRDLGPNQLAPGGARGGVPTRGFGHASAIVRSRSQGQCARRVRATRDPAGTALYGGRRGRLQPARPVEATS